jgi:transglutaminase-like putative cysteine protease
MASRPAQVAWFVVSHVLRAFWVSLMALTPLFGFWLASSLAAYENATQWLSLVVGLLLFPILPLGWDLFFVWRRSKRKVPPKAILTRLDRLVLRTLIVNGLFLGVMMWQARDTSFRALAVRGDWMLDGHDGPIATTVRGWLLGFADRFDRRRAPERHYGESDAAPETVEPEPEPAKPTIEPSSTEPPKEPSGWPLPVAFDPLVVGMPESEQATIESVGRYLAARFTDKRQLVKAIHDYVVGRMHYDYDALRLILAKDYANTPPQTAEAVFERRAAVCEGYARLMSALGDAAGVEIAYITGYIRDSERRLTIGDDPWDTSSNEALEGVSHAWNAAKIDGHWYLIDATWDDPTDHPNTTTYLMTPPRLMAYDHFPEQANWQLLPSPMSLGEFVRQPLLSPSIGEFGLSVVQPTRSQITVEGEATIILDNPSGATIVATARRDGSAKDDEGRRCRVGAGKRTTVSCTLADGEYELQLFAAPASRVHAATGSYRLDYVGSILVNSR